MPRGAPRILAQALVWAAVGLAAGKLATHAWRSVNAYQTPYRFSHAGAPGVERDWRVLLVLVDGLRLDASRSMRSLERVRAQGADLDATASRPSYSRPGRATLVTGASPEIHGATTNRHPGAVLLDNLFRGVARGEGEVAVAGSDLWRSLFGPDLPRASYRESKLKELRGGFERVLPEMASSEWEDAAWLLEKKPRIGVLDLVTPDYAAHEFGSRSPEYGRACAFSDRVIQRLMDDVDLWRTLVVITADHGHIDPGGHGGDEAEVLAVPLVIVGRGVRAGVRGEARQLDVAPTIAALLGLPIPAGSEGRVLTEILDYEGDAEFERSLLQRAAAQQAAFRKDFAASLGVPEADPDAARAERQRRDRLARLPIAIGVLGAAIALLAWMHRDAPRPALLAALGGVAIQEAVFRLLVAREGFRLSLSAINHDEDVRPYFEHLLLLAGIAALAAFAVVTWIAARRREALAAADLGLAAVAGVALFLVARVLVVYWAQGVGMTWTIGSLARGFGAVVDLGRIQVVGLCGLAVPVLAWLFRRPWGRPAAAALLLLAPAAWAGGIHEKVPDAADPRARWAIYLHGRVVELQGKQAVHPDFGPYAYDAIVKAIAERGFEVVAEVRPAATSFEYSKKVAGQVRKLRAADVPASRIVVIGFSKGGALARRASALLGDPDVRFAILAACPRKPEGLEPWVPKMAGHMLSLYDASDEMVGSCGQAFERAPAVKGEETVLEVGKRHGTFFEPRPEWLDPLVAFATR